MKSDIKILIVEDNILTAKKIERKLKEMDYSNIDIAMSYREAMRSIKEERPDLILLDLHLKDGYTGIDIAYEEEVLNKIAIIYITGKRDSKTLESLRATKPKSYLSKPIREEELEFHVSSALEAIDKRRLINLGFNFSYDLEERVVLKNKQPHTPKLTPKEKLLLEELIKTKEVMISPELLTSKLWTDKVPSDNALRMLVSSLRNKLEFEIIINEPYIGYKLNIPKDKI